MSLSRTALLALTAAIAFGAAIASPTSASAWHGGPHWKNHHHNHHWRPHYRPYVYAAPVVYSSYRASAPRVVSAPTQSPSSCLSKAYTPEGQVVFSDNCTKESAMGPVPGVPQQQSEAPAQQNFAGKTFQDFQNSQKQ